MGLDDGSGDDVAHGAFAPRLLVSPSPLLLISRNCLSPHQILYITPTSHVPRSPTHRHLHPQIEELIDDVLDALANDMEEAGEAAGKTGKAAAAPKGKAAAKGKAPTGKAAAKGVVTKASAKPTAKGKEVELEVLYVPAEVEAKLVALDKKFFAALDREKQLTTDKLRNIVLKTYGAGMDGLTEDEVDEILEEALHEVSGRRGGQGGWVGRACVR